MVKPQWSIYSSFSLLIVLSVINPPPTKWISLNQGGRAELVELGVPVWTVLWVDTALKGAL